MNFAKGNWGYYKNKQPTCGGYTAGKELYMKDTEIRALVALAKRNGIDTLGGLKAFYERMKQEGETLIETLARHTREVLGL